LFCSYKIHWTGMFHVLVVLESSGWGGHGLGPVTFGLAVHKFLNIEFFSLKIKLNCSWKFWRNWNVPLVFLERSWWAGFDGIYLVRLGFRMWEILIFKRFLQLKIQINFKNQVLKGKISWGQVHTWANNTAHASVNWNKAPIVSL